MIDPVDEELAERMDKINTHFKLSTETQELIRNEMMQFAVNCELYINGFCDNLLDKLEK